MNQNRKLIVITGASSSLGSETIRYLLTQTQHDIIGFVSPRSSQNHGLPENERLKTITVDLEGPLPSDLKTTLKKADHIIHFAWVRKNNLKLATLINIQVVINLLALTTRPQNFLFISSVAAFPGTKSIYGRSKWEVSQEVIRLGGVILVCGLVLNKSPQGPHKLLVDTIRRLPMRIRFFAPGVPVYPISINSLLAEIITAINKELTPHVYSAFEKEPTNLNQFIIEIEQQFPKIRLPVPVPTGLIVGILRLLSGAKVPPRPLIDKLLTFLVKDENFLNSLKPVSPKPLND